MKAVSGLLCMGHAHTFCGELAGEQAAGSSPLAGKSAEVKYLMRVLRGYSLVTADKEPALSELLGSSWADIPFSSHPPALCKIQIIADKIAGCNDMLHNYVFRLGLGFCHLLGNKLEIV